MSMIPPTNPNDQEIDADERADEQERADERSREMREELRIEHDRQIMDDVHRAEAGYLGGDR